MALIANCPSTPSSPTTNHPSHQTPFHHNTSTPHVYIYNTHPTSKHIVLGPIHRKQDSDLYLVAATKQTPPPCNLIIICSRVKALF